MDAKQLWDLDMRAILPVLIAQKPVIRMTHDSAIEQNLEIANKYALGLARLRERQVQR